MSEEEIFVIPDAETPVVSVKAKPKQAKKEISEERKAQLREQLRRGRETSKANREAKKLKEQPSSEAEAKQIPTPDVKQKSPQEPRPPESSKHIIEEQTKLLREMRNELSAMRKEKNDRAKAKAKVDVVVAPPNSAAEASRDSSAPTPAVAPTPAPAPTPQYYWDARTGKRLLKK